MEYNSPFDSFELQVSAAARDYLKTAAKWAMFLAILGFISIAFMVLMGLVMFAAGGAAATLDDSQYGGAAAIAPGVVGVVYIVIAILYVFPVIYLYKFSSNAKEALNSNNSDKLTTSLQNLKSHYKFLGIVTIIIIVGSIVGGIIMGVVIASQVSGQM